MLKRLMTSCLLLSTVLFTTASIAQADKATVSGATTPMAAPAVAPIVAPTVEQPVPSGSAGEAYARQKTQPGNNAPVWREVNSGKEHYTSIPGKERGVLIQHTGQEWRLIRNGQISLYGGIAVATVFSLIAIFYMIKGPIALPYPPTGRLIERFTSAERMAHWTMAFSFIGLAISGLIIIFGKYVLMPVIGHTLFSWITILAKNIHNFVGPLFSVSIVVFFVMYVKDNFPNASDIKWLLKGGGLLGGDHIPSGRFNMGEKVWFWGGVTFLGIIVSASGYVLDFPNFEQVRWVMQQANVIHGIAALIFICMASGHIYIGSIGMEGALDAMRYGYVDEAWAKAHHEDWFNDIKAGKVPAVRSPEGQNTLGSSAYNPATAQS